MSLAQDYCLGRSVFSKLLVEHPLHMQTLARMEVHCNIILCFFTFSSHCFFPEVINDACKCTSCSPEYAHTRPFLPKK